MSKRWNDRRIGHESTEQYVKRLLDEAQYQLNEFLADPHLRWDAPAADYWRGRYSALSSVHDVVERDLYAAYDPELDHLREGP